MCTRPWKWRRLKKWEHWPKVASDPVWAWTFPSFSLVEGLDKVQSVFKQLMRDWSSLGASEREQCYQPIIKEIVENYPAETCDRSTIQVLVPGAGLGRLAFEIASRGFRCQGNEFNLFMLIVSFYVLNLCSTVDEYVIYPWIHQYCNNHSIEDQMTSARWVDSYLLFFIAKCLLGFKTMRRFCPCVTCWSIKFHFTALFIRPFSFKYLFVNNFHNLYWNSHRQRFLKVTFAD